MPWYWWANKKIIWKILGIFEGIRRLISWGSPRILGGISGNPRKSISTFRSISIWISIENLSTHTMMDFFRLYIFCTRIQFNKFASFSGIAWIAVGIIGISRKIMGILGNQISPGISIQILKFSKFQIFFEFFHHLNTPEYTYRCDTNTNKQKKTNFQNFGKKL